ncbi:hypothetical protein ACHABQ_11580 [Nesterenkonia aurantiaca]|uniref:hypothetical protein n=1 Tax=Nesterenkonia aurantiaca TaxID=1436010 RepID=UPI003EE66822
MTDQQWIITVDEEHLDGIDQVVADLEAAGLMVDRVLRSLGQITGHTASSPGVQAQAADEPPSFSAVAGVASADGAQQHHIAPPDAEVQ